MKTHKARYIILFLAGTILIWAIMHSNPQWSLVERLILPISFGSVLMLWSIVTTIQDRKNAIRKKMNSIKIGCDFHACVTFDSVFFCNLSRILVDSGSEFHIMTGSPITPKLIEELKGYSMSWTHLFSIADYYKNKPDVEMWYDEQNRPWVSDELWNKAKGQYAAEHGLDLVIDDSLEYAKYFTTSFAHCTIVNKSGKERLQKAKMPPRPIKKSF